MKQRTIFSISCTEVLSGRLWSSLVVFLILLVVPATARGATLQGGWACLWHLSTLGQSGSSSAIFNFNQLTQLTVNGTGSVSGTLFFSRSFGAPGEVCDLPVTGGSLSVGANGVGNLSVAFTVSSAAKDEDKDLSCSMLGVTGSQTENYRFVAASSNTKLYFIGTDDFFTPSTTDSGDFPSISGVCERQ